MKRPYNDRVKRVGSEPGDTWGDRLIILAFILVMTVLAFEALRGPELLFWLFS